MSISSQSHKWSRAIEFPITHAILNKPLPRFQMCCFRLRVRNRGACGFRRLVVYSRLRVSRPFLSRRPAVRSNEHWFGTVTCGSSSRNASAVSLLYSGAGDSTATWKERTLRSKTGLEFWNVADSAVWYKVNLLDPSPALISAYLC